MPQVLKTFKELDPYGERDKANYYGTWPSPVGEEPVWPEGKGKRVFVYLKPFQALPSLVDRLVKLELPSIVYVEKVGRKLKEKFDSPTLSFVYGPQNMGRIAAESDIAILNATLNTSVNLLLAGKPALHLPLFLERALPPTISKGSGRAWPRRASIHRKCPKNWICYCLQRIVSRGSGTVRQPLCNHEWACPEQVVQGFIEDMLL